MLFRSQFKLIVVTGNPTLDAAVKTLRSRAVEFLTKPVDLDRLLDATRRALVTDEAAAPASKNDPPVINADAVYRILIGLRSLGDEILPSGYFHDPAWDVILDLIAAEKRGRPLSLTSVGAVGRGAASQSTLQRRVLQLADQGILDIDLDPRDRRRRLVRLSRKGHNMVDELLLRFGALLTRQSASDRSPR